MKKNIFAAAVFAVVSLNSFGAACTDDTFAVLRSQGGCEINGWTLDSWDLAAQSTGYSTNLGGINTPFDMDQILVTFDSSVANRFAVTFKDSSADGNFFNAGANQIASWFLGFNVTGAPIGTVLLSVVDASVSSPTETSQVNVTKVLSDGSAGFLGGNTILTTNNNQSANDVTVYNNQGNLLTQVHVLDSFQINGGNTAGTGAVLASYTNTFYAADPVPEPVTFVLMGAGLMGIAALRRRRT